jgi:hypothetical protein
MRVSGTAATFVRDSLTVVNVPRRCCRPGCPHYAVATLTFVYCDSTAVVGPLATARDPHSWDLCVGHAGRITAPRGWELVRHCGPLPVYGDDDDLVALADAVREAGHRSPNGCHPTLVTPSDNGFAPHAGAGHIPSGSGAPVPGGQGTAGTGRRRGHLRVLPDPN